MRNVLRNVSALTTLACERLKRGSLGDPAHPGLRILVRPSGAKVWVYRYRDPAGKMAQLLIGSFPALSLAEARSEWRIHRASKDKHADPRDAVRRRKEVARDAATRDGGYTVANAAENYRVEHLSKLGRGHEQWRILQRDILPTIGHVPLAELKPSQVMGAIVPIRKRAPRVATMGISALRGLIRHARSMGQFDLNALDPTGGIPTIPQGKRNRALSDPELGILLRWLASGAVSRTVAEVLLLTLYTGARSGEVCAMRSSDVDLDAKLWTHTQGKTGDVSVTPLSEPALAILSKRLSQEHVFSVRGKPLNQKALSVALFASRKAGKACLIDHWTSHDLRRTARTGLARLACPFEVGESILGHRLAGVAAVYNQYDYADEKRTWLDRWAEHLQGIANIFIK
jgi:integrase